MLRFNQKNWRAFSETVHELLTHNDVQSMRQYTHHITVNCFEHSVFVAYVSFRLARRFGLDYVAAARGGLLHDLYLYDHNGHKHDFEEVHALYHPKIALNNAAKICNLSDVEENIIISHMWPYSRKMPRSKEAFIVSCADKYCAIAEFFGIWRRLKVSKLLPKAPVPA